MKDAEEIMDVLRYYDLTKSLNAAGQLAGCSPNTVARYVKARDEGRLTPGAAAPRPSVIDDFLPKLEELVDDSKGKIRADVAHDKITAMGFTDSDRTTRRAVREIRDAFRAGRRRVHRPWIPEPGRGKKHGGRENSKASRSRPNSRCGPRLCFRPRLHGCPIATNCSELNSASGRTANHHVHPTGRCPGFRPVGRGGSGPGA